MERLNREDIRESGFDAKYIIDTAVSLGMEYQSNYLESVPNMLDIAVLQYNKAFLVDRINFLINKRQ
jgi:hypothetical protein